MLEFCILFSGNVSEEQLDQWCKEIDEEESRKEQEALAHAQWLKEREARKQEIERAWRPVVKGSTSLSSGQKRKASDGLDSLMELEQIDEGQSQQFMESQQKPALSPLLTSLLKSPSQVSNVSTPSSLHSAIANQRAVSTVTNPTIASLLNSSTGVAVSPGLQHLVSSAISQDAMSSIVSTSVASPTPDLLEDAADSLPNIKMEDLECSILSSDEPLPEIKNEEVEVIISDLIENADDIVNDPEQHLKLDDNEDIMTNLENVLEELEEEEKEGERPKSLPPNLVPQITTEKEMPKIDPFEFEDEPELYTPSKPSSSLLSKQQYETVKFPEQQFHQEQQQLQEESMQGLNFSHSEAQLKEIVSEAKEYIENEKNKDGQETIPGSVEIVEVVVLEDDMERQLNKNIVYSQKALVESSSIKEEQVEEIKEESENELTESEKVEEDQGVFTETSNDIDIKSETKETSIDLDVTETSRRNTFTPEYSEELYDDLNIEVTKLDKSGKAKRDYSRTKKKEDKDFDILLAVEKAVNAHIEEDTTEDTFSEKEYKDMDKKFSGGSSSKLKSENERSNSPWTEEDDMFIRRRRRYSTPATPSDSVPNSPASVTTYYEDDRDYRNWKKSVMLVYSRLTTHKYASLFLKPITDDQAPGYHSVIYRPMDLQTIRKNIENGAIRTNAEFQRDVLLMFNNAIMYNKTSDHIYNMARQMQQECIQQIQLFLQAQAQTDAPPRRETRTSEPSSKRKRVSDDFSRTKKRKED